MEGESQSNKQTNTNDIDFDNLELKDLQIDQLDDILGTAQPQKTITQEINEIQQDDIYTKDPLEAINIFEMQLSELDKKVEEFIKTEYPQIFGSYYLNLQSNQIKTIEFSTIDYISKLQEKLKKKITIIHVVKEGEIFVGTIRGEVLKFNKKENHPLILNENGQNSAVNCMDIRDQFLIVGYFDGCINIFNLKKGQLEISIKNLHSSSVYFVKFFHDINSQDPFHENEVEKLTDISFLSCDKGDMMKTTFTKGIFSGYKPSSDNYPDLYEYYEIVQRTQKTEEIRISKGNNTIFNSVLYHKNEIIQVDKISVFLQAFITKDSIIIIAESRNTKPMIVLYEQRHQERYRDIEKDQVAVIDFQKDVLLIGWGNLVYVVKLQLEQIRTSTNDYIFQNKFPLKSRYYVNQTPILYSSFIRKNIIFLMDYTNTSHIINLLKFAKEPYKYEENTEQSLNSHVFQSHNIQKITIPKLFKVDEIQIKSYYQSISIFGEKIYILSQGNITANNTNQEYQILEGEILKWEYQLDLKFESKRDINSQFQTLEICLQIYQGKNQSFGEISSFKKDISNYICRKVKESFERYLIELFNFNIKKHPSKLNSVKDMSEQSVRQQLNIIKDEVMFEIVAQNNIIMQYIKYLIITDNTKFMFFDFLDMFKHITFLQTTFHKSLIPYIILNYIKFIPSEKIYVDLFECYEKNQRYDIISKLIFNLDIKQQQDFFYIKQRCNRVELLSCFIYISTRIDNNFKAPLKQLMSDYDSYDQYSEKKKQTLQNQQRQHTKEWIGYKLLWYIKRSLSGLIYPSNQMDEKEWLEVQIIDYTLIIQQQILRKFQSLKNFLSLQHLVFILIYQKIEQNLSKEFTEHIFILIFIKQASCSIFEWIFFEGQLPKLLKIDPDLTFFNMLMFFRGYSHDLILAKESEYKNIFKKQLNKQSSETNKKQDDSFKTLMCKYIRHVLENEKLSQECWNYFYLLLADVKDKDVKLDLELSNNAAVFLLENPSAHFYRNKDLAQEIEIRSRQIIKIIQPHINKSQMNLDDFLKKALISPYVEVCSYIYKLKGDFNSAIKIYLDASYVDIRFKVFSFIKEILESQPENQKEIVEKIFTNLPKLISINHSQTKELLEKIQNYDIHAIIKALDGSDDLVFKILQEYILEQRKKIIEEGQTIPDNEKYLYLEYIKLLAKFQPSEVVNELKTKFYDQDKALKVLIGLDHLQGIAYLQGCHGNIKSALEIYLRLISKYIERKDKNHALKEFKEATELLLRNNKRGDEESENNWFYWITGIQKTENKISKEIIEFQKTLEQESFEALVQNVQIKSILQNKDLLPVLGQNSSDSVNLNKKLYETLQTLLKSYTFEQKIFEYSKDILYNEYCRRENVSFKYSKKGIKLNYSCSQCKTEITKDMTHFYCSHTYCSECVRDYCQVCFEDNKNSCKYASVQEEWKKIVAKHQQYLKKLEEKEEEKRKQMEEQNNNNNKKNNAREEEKKAEAEKKAEQEKKAKELKLILDRKLKKLKNFDKNNQDQRNEVYKIIQQNNN